LYVTYFDWKGRKEGAGRQAETDRQAGREEKGGRMEPDRCEKMREKREYEVTANPPVFPRPRELWK